MGKSGGNTGPGRFNWLLARVRTCIADSAESSQAITDGQGVKMCSWAAAEDSVDDILGHVDPNKWDWAEKCSKQQ